MSRSQRLGFLGIAAVIAVVAVALLASGGGAGNGGGTSSAAQKAIPVLRAGTTTKLTYTQGDQVRFRVAVDQPDAVHVHGYDIERELRPGTPQTIAFKATINGIFEIELHHADAQIGQLTVEPR